MQKERAPTCTRGKAKVLTINLNSAKFKLMQGHAYNKLKETSMRYKNPKKKVKCSEKPKGHPPNFFGSHMTQHSRPKNPPHFGFCLPDCRKKLPALLSGLLFLGPASIF